MQMRLDRKKQETSGDPSRCHPRVHSLVRPTPFPRSLLVCVCGSQCQCQIAFARPACFLEHCRVTSRLELFVWGRMRARQRAPIHRLGHLPGPRCLCCGSRRRVFVLPVQVPFSPRRTWTGLPHFAQCVASIGVAFVRARVFARLELSRTACGRCRPISALREQACTPYQHICLSLPLFASLRLRSSMRYSTHRDVGGVRPLPLSRDPFLAGVWRGCAFVLSRVIPHVLVGSSSDTCGKCQRYLWERLLCSARLRRACPGSCVRSASGHVARGAVKMQPWTDGFHGSWVVGPEARRQGRQRSGRRPWSYCMRLGRRYERCRRRTSLPLEQRRARGRSPDLCPRSAGVAVAMTPAPSSQPRTGPLPLEKMWLGRGARHLPTPRTGKSNDKWGRRLGDLIRLDDKLLTGLSPGVATSKIIPDVSASP